MKFTIICDPIVSLEGSVRPALVLAAKLVEKFTVKILSPYIKREVEEALLEKGLTTISLSSRLLLGGLGSSALWLEAWMREAFFKFNSKRITEKPDYIINFSHTIATLTNIWYTQGPPSLAINDIKNECMGIFKALYAFIGPVLAHADCKFIRQSASSTEVVIANSRFCASMYEKYGVKIHKVIYPPIDLN
ncbi:MAG: hypothetical protein QW701_07155, partial [Candidatus Nezhaarchaeales archaeon]